ncbi:MAG: immunoglobulin domain-containing protein, partial [Bacteroidota bacterium]
IESPPPPPINDECSGAIALTVDTTCNYITFTNIGATASVGVPAPTCYGYSGGDVWFSVIVPATGHLIFDSKDLGIADGEMAIYSGSCGSLTQIACADNGSLNAYMPLINQYGLTSGSTIYIRFWRNNNSTGGAFGLCVYDPPIPINDECSNAIQIIAGTTCSYTTYTNAGATASVGIPAPGCANYIGGDVWFSTIVPASGNLIFDTQSGGVIDGGMAIYYGSCYSLSLITCDDNSSNNGLMPLIFQTGLTPGATIFIRFWRNASSLGGTFGLCVFHDPPPPINDDCSGAVLISVDTICSYTTYSNLGATASVGIPLPTCGNYLGGDVWFKVIVPASGHLVFRSQDQGIGNCSMALYSGNCDSLTLIDCNENFSSVFTMPYLNKYGLTPGSTIYIRFWRNMNSLIGLFGICVQEPITQPVQYPCTNLGFENGLTGWYGTLGNPSSGLANAPSTVYLPIIFNTTTGANFSLMTYGLDPSGNFPRVFEGTTSLKLGDVTYTDTYNAASIEQTFLVTPFNSNFNFHYAVVLDVSYHAYNEQPCFQFELLDSNRNLVPWASFVIGKQTSGVNSNGFLPWTLHNINLATYIGHKVTVNFIVTDCINLAHDCYAYIDCSCLPLEINAADTICQNQSITISAPLGAQNYIWTPGGDTTSSITINPSTTSTYTCEITTLNNTSNHIILVKTITVISSTNPIAGSSSPICTGQTLQLNSSAAGANTYHWTGPNNFVSSDQNPIITNVSNLESGFYTVTSSIGSGCIGTDSVKIIVLPTIANSINPVICQGNSFTVGQHNYINSGTYYDTLTTSMGCDSII